MTVILYSQRRPEGGDFERKFEGDKKKRQVDLSRSFWVEGGANTKHRVGTCSRDRKRDNGWMEVREGQSRDESSDHLRL